MANDKQDVLQEWKFKHFTGALILLFAATLIGTAIPPLGTGLAYYIGMYIGKHFYD